MESNTLQNQDAFPADNNVRWNVPSVVSRAFDDYFGLVLYGTTAKARVTGDGSIMPQAPARVTGLRPPSAPGSVTDFPSLVNHLAFEINKPLEIIVRDYATMVSVFSRLCDQWEKELHKNCRSGYPVPSCYSQKCFESVTLKVNGATVKVREFTESLFNTLRGFKNEPPCQFEWEDFPNQWPPEETGECEHKLISRPWEYHEGNIRIENIVVTVTLIMDTQRYRVPRGFTIEVTGDSIVQASGAAGYSSPSSSSCAYSCSSSALGDDVDD